MSNQFLKSPKHSLVINIKLTSSWISHIQNQYMSRFNLSMAQFNILRILRGANEKLNINTVKERMIEKSPNTTRLTDKLIESGLIDRTRCDKDGRIIYLKINEKGLEVLHEIDKHFEDLFSFTNNLTNEEANSLNYLLAKLKGDAISLNN